MPMQLPRAGDYFQRIKMRLDDFAAVRFTGAHGQISFEEETGRGSGPSGGTAPHGLGSAYARADGCDTCTDTCACACPGTFSPDGGGAVGDQLSLAVAISSVGGAIAGHRLSSFQPLPQRWTLWPISVRIPI